ncbi:MAG: copper chaperone PCu(A)C [Rhodospirillales bacterium]|nr:copper chaperone PCu(A)C [Rhodospirillales bacterium]
MMFFRPGLIGLLITLTPAIAFAHDYKLGALEIGQPWTRATAPTAPSAGGFLTITNKGTVPDLLVSAKSPAAGLVQVHQMTMDGNIMRMRALEHGLEIPARGTVTLAPGGIHLMMMNLKEPLTQGGKVPLTLVFERAGTIEVELDVERMGATRAGP